LNRREQLGDYGLKLFICGALCQFGKLGVQDGDLFVLLKCVGFKGS